MGIESARKGVETYVGDKGGVSRAYAWVLVAYAQALRVYIEVSKACRCAVGEQEDKRMGVRSSEDKKKAFTYLLAYWVLAKAWVWTRV
jgi:hypothetical protein